MAHQGQPPPPPSHIRPPGPPGMFPGGQQRPQPPPGFRPQGPPGQGGPGPMQMHLPPKIIQQSSRIRDITPQKVLTEADCLQKLTTLAAFSVRKVPPQHPGEKATWARAEVTEDRLDQADIKKAIKKLSVGKSVAEKRQALAQFQQGQVTALLDDLASKEMDRNFEWSLVQIDRAEKQVPSSSRSGKKAIETTVMNLYVKRAPLPGLDAVILLQQAEKRRFESLRPPPPPQQPQPQPPPFHHERPPSAHGMRPQSAHGMRPQSAHEMRKGEQGRGFVEISRGHPKSPRSRHQRRRYHDDSSSSGSSGSYDTESDSGSDMSSSLDTSVSSRSNHRRRRHSKGATRSHSRHRPKYTLEDHRRSPEPRPSDAYGVPHHQHPQHPLPQQLHNPNPHQQQHPQIHQQHPPPQRPFVPDVPRMVPAMDPIHSAYQAGKEDARAEIGDRSPVSPQPVFIDRIIERPVIVDRPVIERPPIERVIERPPIEHIVEAPRPVVSYTRLPVRPRFSEPRYTEARYADEVRHEDDEYLIRRREAEDNAILREHRMRRDAEDYMDRRPEPIGRRPSYSIRGDSPPPLSPGREFFDRRPNDLRDRDFRRPEVRRVFTTPVEPHPFAQVPRRYPRSNSSASYTEAGW